MTLKFDSAGNLIPNSNIRCSLQLFYEIFVESIPSPVREELFNNFQKYLDTLKKLLDSDSLTIWIDGSYTTKKIVPNDMDLVVFINHTLVENFEQDLEDFKFPNSLSKFGLDAYIVKVYPRDHKNYHFYISDEMYWRDLFDKNRRNRRGIKIPKGFIEINN